MSIRNWIAGAGLLLLSACSSGEQGFEEEALRYCDNQVRRTLAELKDYDVVLWEKHGVFAEVRAGSVRRHAETFYKFAVYPQTVFFRGFAVRAPVLRAFSIGAHGVYCRAA